MSATSSATAQSDLPVHASDIAAALRRIRSAGMRAIPCHRSERLSDLAGCDIYCKMEHLHPTGSFKERGACNALQVYGDRARGGVIAASAGNHAQALAYHGRRLGVPVTVVMPETAPLTKIRSCRSLGASVILHGQVFGEARDRAVSMGNDQGLVYLHGFNDPGVIAGAGTCGMEILDQVHDVDTIIVPVGGGGLIAGIATIVKHRRPDVQIIGVEAEGAPTLSAALEAGKPVDVTTRSSIADGLAIPRLGDNCWPACRDFVDRVVKVSESETARAVLNLLELEKAVVEGSGATSLAAVTSILRDELAGKKVAIILCGGNIDTQVLGRIIERGLAADGRLTRLVCCVTDRPGSLSRVLQIVGDAGASVREVHHDRSFGKSDVGQVDIGLVLETNDRGHVEHVQNCLTEAGIDFWIPQPRSTIATLPVSAGTVAKGDVRGTN